MLLALQSLKHKILIKNKKLSVNSRKRGRTGSVWHTDVVSEYDIVEVSPIGGCSCLICN